MSTNSATLDTGVHIRYTRSINTEHVLSWKEPALLLALPRIIAVNLYLIWDCTEVAAGACQSRYRTENGEQTHS